MVEYDFLTIILDQDRWAIRTLHVCLTTLTPQFEIRHKGTKKVQMKLHQVVQVPDKWDMSFRNCVHGHIWQYQPCTSARVFADSLFPLAPQMILLPRMRYTMNNLTPDVQETPTMVVFVYQEKLSNAQ